MTKTNTTPATATTSSSDTRSPRAFLFDSVSVACPGHAAKGSAGDPAPGGASSARSTGAGLPQCGQLAAAVETRPPQSAHVINGTGPPRARSRRTAYGRTSASARSLQNARQRRFTILNSRALLCTGRLTECVLFPDHCAVGARRHDASQAPRCLNPDEPGDSRSSPIPLVAATTKLPHQQHPGFGSEPAEDRLQGEPAAGRESRTRRSTRLLVKETRCGQIGHTQ